MIGCIFRILTFVFFISLIISCSEDQSENEKAETPVSGKLTVYIDPSFAGVIRNEVAVFLSQFPKATITLKILPEERAIGEFLKDSVEMLVTSRSFSEDELKVLKKEEITFYQNLFAREALVIIAHPAYPDTSVSFDQLKKLISHSSDEKLSVITDQSNSSNVRFIREIFETENISVTAAGSDSAVINYISEHQNVLGFISFSYFSDQDSRKVIETLKRVKILYVNRNAEKPVYPSQSSIFTGEYPLIRNLNLVNRAYRTGLGTGFANFIMSQKGQKIILKEGLVPGKMPERKIEIK